MQSSLRVPAVNGRVDKQEIKTIHLKVAGWLGDGGGGGLCKPPTSHTIFVGSRLFAHFQLCDAA